MSSGRVVVVGSLNLDVVSRVPHLPRPGETLLGVDLVRLSGGKGGNQAHAAACSAPPGVRVAMVGRVGDDDAGRLLRTDLARVGVDVVHVGVAPGPSGTALIAVDAKGENTIVVHPGANADWSGSAIETFAIDPGDVVVVQLEIPFPVVASVVTRAHAAGARVVLNAAPLDSRVLELLDGVAVLVVNEGEAAELFGLDTPIDPDAVRAIARTLPTDLVVTLGARGGVVAPADAATRPMPAFVVDVVDTVGAGDAFVGALAAALASGASLHGAARWGAAAGALTATVRGARHPTLDRDAVAALAGGLE